MSVVYDCKKADVLVDDLSFSLEALTPKLRKLANRFPEYDTSYWVQRIKDSSDYKLNVFVKSGSYNRKVELHVNEYTVSSDTYAEAIYNVLTEELVQRRLVLEARRLVSV